MTRVLVLAHETPWKDPTDLKDLLLSEPSLSACPFLLFTAQWPHHSGATPPRESRDIFTQWFRNSR